MKHQFTPLRKSVKQSKLICYFKDGFIIPIINAKSFLRFLKNETFRKKHLYINKNCWKYHCNICYGFEISLAIYLKKISI